MKLPGDGRCLRCGGEMEYLGAQQIQLGETGILLGDWPNILAGSLSVEIFRCRDCGRLEFFQHQEEESRIAQRECPRCGRRHDMDDPRCPACGYDYWHR